MFQILSLLKKKFLETVKKFDYLTYIFFFYLVVLLGAFLFFGAPVFAEWIVILFSYYLLSRNSNEKHMTGFFFISIFMSFLMLSSVVFFYWLDPSSYLLIQKHSLFASFFAFFESPPSFSVGENDVARSDPLYKLLDRQTESANTSRATYVSGVVFSGFWNATALGGSMLAGKLCFNIAKNMPTIAGKTVAYGVSGVVSIAGVVYSGLTENPYNGLVKSSHEELTLDLAARRLTELQILQRENARLQY